LRLHAYIVGVELKRNGTKWEGGEMDELLICRTRKEWEKNETKWVK